MPGRPFSYPSFRRLFAGTMCATLASRGMAVVLGYQVYALTGSKMALAVLGLVEAIPAVSLGLFGGHIADRRDRRVILQFTLSALTACAVALAVLQGIESTTLKLGLLYAVVFAAGIARGFAEPAAGALEAQVVPREILMRASTSMATCWLLGATVGPLVAGFAFDRVGPTLTYSGVASLYAVAALSVLGIAPTPIPVAPSSETI